MDPTHSLFGKLPSTKSFELQAKSLIAASEANIARIESQIRDLERLRDMERGVIARLRMAIAPIHKLPTELLVEIFLYVHHNAGRFLYTRTAVIKLVHVLSQVCAYWRRVAHTTPQLWIRCVDMVVSKPPTDAYIAGMKGWLERSAPLRVPVSLRISGNTADPAPLMDVLFDAAHRWSSAEFSLNSLSALSRIPLLPLENLQRLTLSCRARSHTRVPAFLTARRLCDVSLSTRRTAQLMMPWSQLTKIRVTDPSPLECLDSLIQCPNIVTAQFDTLAWDDIPDLSARSMSTLGQLKDLSVSFSDSTSGFVTPFFVRLALPALKKLYLDLQSEISWQSPEFTQFQLNSPNMEWLSIDSSFMSSNDLMAILQHAPSLVELHMDHSPVCFDDSIVTALQYSGTDLVHLAPRLQTLSLTEAGINFDEDAMDAMIQSRWWTDEQLLAFPSAPKVSRWSSILIYGGEEEDDVGPELESKLEVYRAQGLDVTVYGGE
ncbi:hypothetical protein DFH06DRAFT_1481072 [Mycena polygramma]|nr:hypothetical protein DFH06DRAFT_1481072 [Mycena polygramma]